MKVLAFASLASSIIVLSAASSSTDNMTVKESHVLYLFKSKTIDMVFEYARNNLRFNTVHPDVINDFNNDDAMKRVVDLLDDSLPFLVSGGVECLHLLARHEWSHARLVPLLLNHLVKEPVELKRHILGILPPKYWKRNHEAARTFMLQVFPVLFVHPQYLKYLRALHFHVKTCVEAVGCSLSEDEKKHLLSVLIDGRKSKSLIFESSSIIRLFIGCIPNLIIELLPILEANMNVPKSDIVKSEYEALLEDIVAITNIDGSRCVFEELLVKSRESTPLPLDCQAYLIHAVMLRKELTSKKYLPIECGHNLVFKMADILERDPAKLIARLELVKPLLEEELLLPSRETTQFLSRLAENPTQLKELQVVFHAFYANLNGLQRTKVLQQVCELYSHNNTSVELKDTIATLLSARFHDDSQTAIDGIVLEFVDATNADRSNSNPDIYWDVLEAMMVRVSDPIAMCIYKKIAAGHVNIGNGRLKRLLELRPISGNERLLARLSGLKSVSE